MLYLISKLLFDKNICAYTVYLDLFQEVSLSELNYENLFASLDKEDLSPLSNGFLSESLLKEHRTCWWMKMGITIDTKETLGRALKLMGKTDERN